MDATSALPAPAARRRRTGIRTIAALATVGVAAGVAFGVGAAPGSTPGAGQGTAQVEPEENGFGGVDRPRGGGYGAGSAASTATATSAQQVGVVDIASVLGYQNAQAAGTGMILTSTGDVLTNNHVIAGTTSITVTVASTGASYAATVVGTDPSADVAVLHLDGGSGLATAALSTSPAAVGEAVTAVGNTGGTGTLSVANGTVTALGHRKGEWAGRRVHCRGDSSPERGQRDGDATSRVPTPGTAVRRPAGQPTSIRTRAQELLS